MKMNFEMFAIGTIVGALIFFVVRMVKTCLDKTSEDQEILEKKNDEISIVKESDRYRMSSHIEVEFDRFNELFLDKDNVQPSSNEVLMPAWNGFRAVEVNWVKLNIAGRTHFKKEIVEHKGWGGGEWFVQLNNELIINLRDATIEHSVKKYKAKLSFDYVSEVYAALRTEKLRRNIL